MSEDLLIRHCSPTLAGIKTGKPVFLCLPMQEGTDKICIQVKQETGAQGEIRILPLRVCQGRALIYGLPPLMR